MNRRELMMLLLGGAMTAPRLLRAQQKAMPVVGFLGIAWPALYESRLDAFRQGLSEIGRVEGQNLTIEYRWAEDRYDRLPALATELVGRKVDMLVATATPAALAAKSATPTIPIVFVAVADPVAVGLAARSREFVVPGPRLGPAWGEGASFMRSLADRSVGFNSTCAYLG